MKKEVTKVVTIATTSAIAASSVLNPAVVLANTTPEDGNSQIEKSDDTQDYGGYKEARVAENTSPSTIRDVGVTGKLTGYILKVGNVYYSNDARVKLVSSSLRDGVSISKACIYAIKDGNEDVDPIIEIPRGNGEVDVPSFEGKLQIRYFMSDGVVLKQYLSDVISEASSLNNLVRDDIAPESVYGFEYSNGFVERNGYTYATSSDCKISITCQDDGVGINPDTWLVEGVDNNYSVSEDGRTVEIPVGRLSEGMKNIKVSVADKLGNTSKVYSTSVNVYLNKPDIVVSSLEGDYVTVGDTSYIGKDSSLDFILGTLNTDRVEKIELLDGDSVVTRVLDNTFKITNSGTYILRVTDVLGEKKVKGLSDLVSGISNNIDIDEESPVLSQRTFNGTTEKVEGLGYVYTSNGDINLSFDDSKSGVDMSTLSIGGVNGEYTVTGNTVTINTSVLAEGSNEITYSISDKLGNTLSSKIRVFMMREVPEITGKSHGEVVNVGSKSYTTKAFKVELDELNQPTIKKAVLLKEGTEVSDLSSSKFDIKETGKYGVRVYDVLGNYKDYSLQELFEDLYSDVVFDLDKPVFENKGVFTGQSKTYDGVVYYTSNGEVEVGLNDTGSGLNTDSIEVLDIDGKEIEYSYNEGKLKINSGQFEDGEVDLLVNASDMLGNSIRNQKISFMLHRSFPDVRGKNHSDVLVSGDKSYTKETVTVSLDGADSYKVSSVKLLKDGKAYSDIEDGSFEISESGEYSVRVYDITGESKTYSLEELFDDNGICSKITFDTEAPEVISKSFDGDKIVADDKTYYSGNGTISLKFSDDYSGIDKDTYRVEGISDRYVSISDDASLVSIDTRGLEEGSTDLSITVSDILGNSNSFTLRVQMHREFPEISGTTHGKTYVKGTSAYIDRETSFTLGNTDNYKIKRIELLKDGESIKEIKNGTFSISNTGNYKVKVTDIVNNYKVYTLEELYGDTYSDIILDTTSPEYKSTYFTGNSEVVDGTTYYTSNGSIIIDFIDNGCGVDASTWEVSGVGSDLCSVSSEGTSMIISTEGLSEGNTNITVSVRDMLGHKSETKLYAFMHRSFPEISGISHSDVLAEGNKTYISNPISVKLGGYNSHKIKDMELLKDGKKVSNISRGMFNIRESGSYTVLVRDLLGKTREYRLEELFSDIKSNVVVDTDAPVFSNLEFSGDSVEVDGTTYYTSDGNITIRCTDNLSGIDKDSWSISGATGMEISEDGKSISVPTNNLKEGSLDLTVSVRDRLGNSSSYKLSAYILRSAPEISGKEHSDVVIDGNKTYINKSLSIALKGTDNEKIRRIELLKNGEVVNEINNSKFSINESGSYLVRVVDLVNNYTVYRFEDLFKDLVSDVVSDRLSPVAKTTINGSEINSKIWITNKGNLEVKLSDDIGLKRAVVSVNGKNFIYNYDLNKSDTVKIDLMKDVPRADNGKYNIEVKVFDISGNVYTADTKTVSADFDAPTFKGLNAYGNYLEDSESGKVYLKGALTVTGATRDIGSGVEKVELLRGGKVVANKLPFNISESGKYVLRVTDVAGLYTEVSLNDVLRTNSNSLIVDNDAPLIQRVNGFEPALVESGIKWFNKAPELVYRVTDENIKKISIKVNGDDKVNTVNSDGIYRIDTSGYEGRVVVEVSCVDYIGNKSRDVFEYISDFSSPVNVSAAIDEDYREKSGSIFFKSNPTISISAADNGIGIREYLLSGSKKDSNTYGKFTLGDGSYGVELVDKLGNSTGVLQLGSLLGMSGENFVVDSESPNISVKKKQTNLYSNWYAIDVDYNINLTDDVGINRAEVMINGQIVNSYETENTNETSVNLSASTREVPKSDNGMYEIKVGVEDNAGNYSSYSDVIYIDRTAPTVNRFIFNGSGYSEGAEINGSDRYGFFFDGSATCDIYVSDGTVSSGVEKVRVMFSTVDGITSEEVVPVSGGVASVNIPTNFKGFVYAYAIDNVGNVGSVVKPDGIVTENGNFHINNVSLDLKLPDTKNKDTAGNPLYNKDTEATVNIGCGMSGIREVRWGIDSQTLGSLTVTENGEISGDKGVIKSKDKNLVLDLSKTIAMQGNTNGMKLWVNVTDRTGHVSETSKVFSIDKDIPTISVEYDKSEEDNYYNVSRVAKITVKERNFDPSTFKVEGTPGKLGSWSNNGDTWTNTLTFSEDGKYKYSLICSDRAENVSKQYESDSFVIDKTAPKLSVSWNEDKPSNGSFYNKRRVATITVVERNFDGNLFKISGDGTLSAWKSKGDVHKATVVFDKDGTYSFSISGKDLSGNASETYESGKFSIDTTNPKLEIEGVEDGVSYKEDLGFTVKMSDNNIDVSKSSVTLKGRKNGNIRVNGIINEKTGEYSFNSFPKEETYDDIYTLTAILTDKAGNVSKKSLSFSVNRFGSKYSFANPEMLGTYLCMPRDVVINEVNVDKLDTEKAKISVIRDGVEITVDPRLIHIEESGGEEDKYNYKYTVDKSVFSEDGKYLVQVFSTSVSGTEYNSVSEEYAFVLDTQKPEIIISGVKSKDKYKDYERTVTIDVRDKSGVNSIVATLNGEEVALSKKNGIYSFVVKESSDPQNIVVTVTDLAGNESVQKVEDFIVSSDTAVFVVNQPWFKMGMGALAALLGGIVFLILRSRKKSKKAEESSALEYTEIYKTSTGSGSGSGASTSSESVVEDLDVDENATTDIMESDLDESVTEEPLENDSEVNIGISRDEILDDSKN